MPKENIWSKIHDRLVLSRYISPFARRNQDRTISTRNTLCLFCNPRGGSTWLAEIMMHIPGSVLIDEPLWRGRVINPYKNPDPEHRKVPLIADLNFFYNQHIPEHEDWPEAKYAFEEILTGRVPSLGLYAEQDLSRLRHGGFYITKFCYANLLMPWLTSQFDFSSILLTRHPCSVVASQLRYPEWRDMAIPISGKMPDFPHQQFYQSALEKIGKIDSRVKYLALVWALGFKNTAMHPKNNKAWLTISYEGLMADPKSEIERIANRFSFPLQDLSIDFARPSKSTKPGSIHLLQNGRKKNSWQKALSTKQKAIIFDVLEKMEIDLYTENREPDFDRLYATGHIS